MSDYNNHADRSIEAARRYVRHIGNLDRRRRSNLAFTAKAVVTCASLAFAWLMSLAIVARWL